MFDYEFIILGKERKANSKIIRLVCGLRIVDKGQGRNVKRLKKYINTIVSMIEYMENKRNA